MQKIIKRLSSFWGSNLFFKIIVGFFVFQAVWLVLSAVYPGAFDEAFHLGVIKIYAQNWLPFMSQQPENADVFGAVFRDGSYLFHYLMSFPYRLLTLLTSNETAIIIVLRLMNVAMFAGFLLVAKKVLNRAGIKKAVGNTALLLLTLVPIVPQIASQINYDNLLVLLVAIVVLYVQKSITKLQNNELPLVEITTVVTVSLFASIVKYAYLPIFAGIFFFYLGAWLYYRRKNDFKKQIKPTFTGISAVTKILLILALVVGLGLFVERFGVNTIKYGSPVPDCGKVMSTNQCMEFPPWGRDYRYAQDKPDFTPNTPGYVAEWSYGMWHRLFFAINGDTPVDRYNNYPGLPLPSIAFVLLVILGLFATLKNARSLYKNPFIIASSVIALSYIGILWYQNYSMYTDTGRAVAVNGRYLIIVALPLAVVLGSAVQLLFKKRQKTSLLVAALAVAMFLQGGGIVNFIVRSKDTWYWSNQTVVQINSSAQDIIKPITLGAGSDSAWYKFLNDKAP